MSIAKKLSDRFSIEQATSFLKKSLEINPTMLQPQNFAKSDEIYREVAYPDDPGPTLKASPNIEYIRDRAKTLLLAALTEKGVKITEHLRKDAKGLLKFAEEYLEQKKQETT